jgi:hypothetical protein
LVIDESDNVGIAGPPSPEKPGVAVPAIVLTTPPWDLFCAVLATVVTTP